MYVSDKNLWITEDLLRRIVDQLGGTSKATSFWEWGNSVLLGLMLAASRPNVYSAHQEKLTRSSGA
jgi:hypothetical protein